MKICPKCKTQTTEDAEFCTGCGLRFEPTAKNRATRGGFEQTYDYQSNNAGAYGNPVANYSKYDHTAEFDAADVSGNKVFAVLAYLAGIAGVIAALLAGEGSPYTRFHARQALKFTVSKMILVIIAVIMCWTVVVPIACAVTYLVLFVIKIVCFFEVCAGKSKEPVIIRDLGFLR